MITRRELLETGVAMAALSSLPRAALAETQPLHVLILGGTNYVGPHIVHSTKRAGHEVTLFNRGITNPHLFPELEKLRGDRTKAGGLEALGLKREWDVVIDTWAQTPRAVEESAKLLRGRTNRYAYVSSIAVYGSFRKVGLTESDPILALDRRPGSDGEEMGYLWAKRLAEASVLNHFPKSHLIARGSSIFGFDSSAKPDNQNLYWPLRIRAGGSVLAPGDGSDLVQYTDVGTIADFIVANSARGVSGAFNVAEKPVSFRRYLETIATSAESSAELVWIPKDFLIRNGGTPFEKVPLWIPADDPEPGFYRFNTAKAHAAGLRSCALEKTVSAVLATFADKPAAWQPDWQKAGGMAPELEKAILNSWASQPG